MTPQELKASILQLAIQGKLVPQLPEEGTGEELFLQIQAEKQRLIKAGTIKKEKPLPEITEDEIPFDIPDTWKHVKLGEVFCLEMGQSPDGNTVSETGDGIEFHQGKVYFGKMELQLSPQKTTSPTKYAQSDSVLLCVRAPVGKVNITKRKVCIGRGLCAVKPICGISVEFVYYWLATLENTFIKKATGTTFVAITGEVVKNQVIPLPPLAEQKRIVAKIEELLPLIDCYEQAWSRLENFNKRFPVDMQKSILQMAIQGKLVPQLPEEGTGEELFQQIQTEKQALIKAGKIKKEKLLPEMADDEIPFDIPDTWKWVRFGELVNECFQGINTAADHVVFEREQGVPIIQTGDVTSGKLNVIGTKLMSEVDYSKYCEKYQPRYNDIFYCNIGTIGKPYIFTENYKMLFHWNLFIIRYNHSCVLPMYLKTYLEYCTDYFKRNTDGTAMQFVSKKKLVNILVPLPPLAEQKRIVVKLEEILPLCERLK